MEDWCLFLHCRPDMVKILTTDHRSLFSKEKCTLSTSPPITVLCIASYEKGFEFLRECKRQNCCVLLLTAETLAGAGWPREAIDEIFYTPPDFRRDDLIKSASYLARTRQIDRVVPLDDFDVETAAALREHLRIPGMGDTTARYFRDKLAMRVKARDHQILVPEFVHVLNYDTVRDFMRRVPPPWVLKPRSEASAVGIKKVECADDLWPLLDVLGDRQSFYVLEQFIPGDIFHIDSIVSEREVVFSAVHKYGQPPMDVAHYGGVFMTRTVSQKSEDHQALELLNRSLMQTLGLVRGVTHTEFIKGYEDGRFYFLETASRVGGANIAEVVGVRAVDHITRAAIAGDGTEFIVKLGFTEVTSVAAVRAVFRSLHLVGTDSAEIKRERGRDLLGFGSLKCGNAWRQSHYGRGIFA